MSLPGALRLPVLLLFGLLLPWPLHAESSYRFTGVDRVVVVGDVHGDLDALVTALRGTGVIDEHLAWAGGETHLVSLGDLLDRGDEGRQVMDLVMRLAREASEAGGAVHMVHGNHEVMNLTGDLRYVSEGDFAQFGSEARDGKPPGFFERRAAFAPDGVYGRWLLSLPVAMAIDDTLFLHGGVSSVLDGMSLDAINAQAMRDIRRFAEGWHVLLESGEVRDDDGIRAIVARAGELAQTAPDPRVRSASMEITEAYEGLPFVPEGPLWYRGNARCHPFVQEETTARILAGLGVRRVVTGHTPTDDRRIVARMDGQVIRADTGMNAAAYQGRASAVIIEQGALRAWYPDADAVEIASEEQRSWHRPFGLDDERLEAFLRTADVIADEPVEGSGLGRRKLTLELDGRQVSAMFNTVDTAPGLPAARWSRSAEQAQRWAHDIAAYRLDRVLGFELVPVTVERVIDGQAGAVRLWPEPSFSEAERQARSIPFRGDCALADQYRLMNLFDVLVFNAGQDLENLRYDQRGHLWLMDQSRAFGPMRDVRAMLRRAELAPPAGLARALEGLTRESLAPLEGLLHPRQLDAILSRAEQIRRQR